MHEAFKDFYMKMQVNFQFTYVNQNANQWKVQMYFSAISIEACNWPSIETSKRNINVSETFLSQVTEKFYSTFHFSAFLARYLISTIT